MTAEPLVREFLASPHCAGMSCPFYDPDLDPEGTIALRIGDFLRDAISLA